MTTNTFTSQSQARLIRAEQTGLRLALGLRTLITGFAFAWYVVGTVFIPEMSPRIATVLGLFFFTAVGAAHLVVIGTRFDRAWMKYAVYTLDVMVICAAFALIPVSRADNVPQIIAFRAYGIYFLFPLLAVACFSLSWKLVIWTGTMIVIGWWAAFVWVVSRMESFLSWADMPTLATRADYEDTFLSIDFIGRGNRIEETAMVFFAAVALAVAVYRARAVFFAQVAAEMDRERVSGLLGKYVPEAIAERLIADATPLAPQRSAGTALVMDIADFTRFSAQHPPEYVIETLDAFLSEAAQAVSEAGGIVMSYLGDGFLVTFNAPVAVADPAGAALRSAKALTDIAARHDFGIRVGIASGDLVTGTIGSDTRQSFTVYGDAVNRAARLEAHAKQAGAAIVLDQATQAKSQDFAVTRLEDAKLGGFDGATPVYALV